MEVHTNKMIKLNKEFQFDISEFFKKLEHFFEKFFGFDKKNNEKLNEKLNLIIENIENLTNNERMNNNFIRIYNSLLKLRKDFSSIIKIKNVLTSNKIKYETKLINSFKTIDRGSFIYKITLNPNKYKILPNLCLKIVYEISEGNYFKYFENEIKIMKLLTDKFLKTYKTPHLMIYINEYNNNDNLIFVKKNIENEITEKEVAFVSSNFGKDLNLSNDDNKLIEDYFKNKDVNFKDESLYDKNKDVNFKDSSLYDKIKEYIPLLDREELELLDRLKKFRGLLSEYADLGDLEVFLKSKIQNNNEIDDEIFRNLFFQLFFTLFIIYEKYPNFRHKDLRIQNILVFSSIDDKNKYFVYKIFNEEYYLPCIGFQIRLWDFDETTINSKNDSCFNQDFDTFFNSLQFDFNENFNLDTKNFIESLSSTGKKDYHPRSVVKCNDVRDYNKLKKLIWDSNYFKPYKIQQGGEIIEYYNTSKKKNYLQ